MGSGPDSRDLGVVGWPLTTTFSPVMQNAALDACGLAWRYDAIPVSPDEFGSFLRNAAQTMRGMNVTMPHKHAAYCECAETDELATLSKNVNTIIFDGGILYGHNTDGPGLLRALGERAGFSARGSSVVLLGAGGSAAGCAAALGVASAAKVSVLNRTYERSVLLCDAMRARLPNADWCAISGHDQDALQDASLVISCVPEESSCVYADLLLSLRPDALFMDLSYSNRPTLLHDVAVASGMKTVPGLWMLLWQGALSFEIFTSRPAPVEIMQDALTEVAGRWWV